MKKLNELKSIPRLFTKSQCKEIINIADTVGWRDGVTYDVGSDKPKIDHRGRLAFSVTLDEDHDDHEWIYSRVKKAFHKANRYYDLELGGAVTLYVVSYPENGHIALHSDAMSDMTEKRKLSFSAQLSDPDEYEGGDLYFPLAIGDKEASRKRGSATVFPSVMLHRVNPISKGQRYALIGWVEGTRPLR